MGIQVKAKTTASVQVKQKVQASIIADGRKAAPKKGIGYLRSRTFWGLNQVSLYNGDERWRFYQGEFNNQIPENPTHFAALDTDSPDYWTTLKYNNKFGNKNRFTAIDGSQNYESVPSPYANYAGGGSFILLIDHLYNKAWISQTFGLKLYTASILDGFTFAPTYEAQGLTDWRVASYGEYLSVARDDVGLTYSPFNYVDLTGVRFVSNFVNNGKPYAIPIQDSKYLPFAPYQINSPYCYFLVKNLDP